VTEYTWDYRNRLAEVTDRASLNGDATQVVDYIYDVRNHLVGKLTDPDGVGEEEAAEEYFGYDGNQVFFRFAGPELSDLADRYLWAPVVDLLLSDEKLTAPDEPGDIYWALQDNLNTVRDIAHYDPQTDTTSVANHRVFDAFGNMTSQTNAAVDLIFGFTGRQRDGDTGLQNNWHRWYDPAAGRWLSEDPKEYGAGDFNLYRYCGNMPTNGTDPSGLGFWGSVGNALGTAWYYTKAAGQGVGQGALNIVNGAQDAVIAIPNIVPAAWNITGGNLGGGRLGYIPSPDWSKDVIIQDDPTHGVSKFVGGQGVVILVTVGTSQLGHASHLRHLTSAEAAEEIVAEGVIRGSQGVYATARTVTSPTLLKTMTFARHTSGYVEIPKTAMSAFRPVPVSGPITAWTRCIGGGYMAQAKSLNLLTGAQTPLTGLHALTLVDTGIGIGLQAGLQVSNDTIHVGPNPPYLFSEQRLVVGCIRGRTNDGLVVRRLADMPATFIIPVQTGQDSRRWTIVGGNGQ
jgi:RHS repeat-associated protein